MWPFETAEDLLKSMAKAILLSTVVYCVPRALNTDVVTAHSQEGSGLSTSQQLSPVSFLPADFHYLHLSGGSEMRSHWA